MSALFSPPAMASSTSLEDERRIRFFTPPPIGSEIFLIGGRPTGPASQLTTSILTRPPSLSLTVLFRLENPAPNHPPPSMVLGREPVLSSNSVLDPLPLLNQPLPWELIEDEREVEEGAVLMGEEGVIVVAGRRPSDILLVASNRAVATSSTIFVLLFLSSLSR